MRARFVIASVCALGAVLGGDLGPLLSALQAAEQAELLAHG